MKPRMLIALAVAAAFALPAAVQAQPGGPAGASAQGTGVTGGAPRGGGPGPERASMGEPQDFLAMDRDSDGRISRAEWDNHFRAGGASAGGTTAGPSTDRTPASEPRGTTGGPGAATGRTGPGSATATQPGTSGHGVPK